MSISNLYYSIREQWKGSGVINIGIIALTTIVLYIVFIVLNYDNSLPSALLGGLDSKNFSNTFAYQEALENLKIDEIIILTPIITAVILLTVPTLQFKENIQNRLLPVSSQMRLLSFFISVISITVISFLLLIVLNISVVYFIKSTYLSELIRLQEEQGDLYKQLHSDFLLSTNYSNDKFLIRSFPIVIALSVLINLCLLIFSLLFQKYSILKCLSILVLAVILSANLNTIVAGHFLNLGTRMIINFGNPILYISALLIPCACLGLFYLLKEREE